MKTSLIAFTIFFFASAVSAQVLFDNVVGYGTGCPEGTVSTSVSPDGSTLSVLFDEFRVEVPEYSPPAPPTRGGRYPRAPRTRPTRAMRDCQLRFTANLQPGTMVEAVEISLSARGSTILDPGIVGSFTSILVGYNGLSQSRGRPVPVVQKYWNQNPGGVMDDWTEMPTAVIPLHSGCAAHTGRAITFDMKNHLSAEIITGDMSKSGLISVDSADMTGMLRFKFRIRPCGGVRETPTGVRRRHPNF